MRDTFRVRSLLQNTSCNLIVLFIVCGPVKYPGSLQGGGSPPHFSMTVEAVAPAPETVETVSTPTTCPITSAKILKQVEFYFSDANLPRDRFLQEKIKENDGWIQLSLLTSFSRLKALSEDLEVIAAAIEQSEELLELNEERTAVRRKTEVSTESKDNLQTSVYVKGFALTATLDEIEAFIGSVWDGKVQAIRMRRHPKTKEFKGSVFVELESAEEAERLAAMTLSLPEATEPLVLLVKAKYFEQKNAERTGKTGKKAEVAEKEARPFEYTKGCLLYVEAVPEGVTFEQIKEALNAVRPVAFADIVDKEKSVAAIRFKEAMPEGEELPEGVATFKVGEHELTSRRATEEEEKTYYEDFLSRLRAKASQRKGGNRKGGRPAKRQRN